MTRRRVIVAALASVASVAAVGVGRAELPTHKAKPRPLCGVPDFPYRVVPPNGPPPTVTAISLPRIAVPPTGVAAAPAARPPQVYQFAEARLQIDHCFLSRFAVTLHDDGTYQIGFRADQNPIPVNDLRNGPRGDPQGPQPLADPRSPLRPGERVSTLLQTTQFRRNTFIVKVRGYGAYEVKADEPNRVPGRPVLVELPAEVFQVQRGEPYSGFFTNRSDAVRRYFDSVDRVELEFTYR